MFTDRRLYHPQRRFRGERGYVVGFNAQLTSRPEKALASSVCLGNGTRPLEDATKAGAATPNYGLFLNNVIDFLIIAVSIFLAVRQVNKLLVTPEEPATKSCPFRTSAIPVQATQCPQCTSTLDSATPL